MSVLQEQTTAVLMLSAIIPWDHICALAYLHYLEMDEFAKVNYFFAVKGLLLTNKLNTGLDFCIRRRQSSIWKA